MKMLKAALYERALEEQEQEKAAVEANCLELDQEHVGDDTVVGLGEVDKQDERAEASALAAREHLE